MGAFNDIELEWEGRKYTIRHDRVLKCLGQVEDIVTLAELQKFYQRETAPMAKIAMAYGAVLRYAGAKVSDEDVATGLTSENTEVILTAIMGLLTMMMPKPSKTNGKATSDPKDHPVAAIDSSKKLTKSRSVSGE
jgi:hypothetical protein